VNLTKPQRKRCYGHLAPEHLRTAVARLDAALPVLDNYSERLVPRGRQRGGTGALLLK